MGAGRHGCRGKRGRERRQMIVLDREVAGARAPEADHASPIVVDGDVFDREGGEHNDRSSEPRRGGPSYLFPPFSYVAKEHGSVAIGAARHALDELIALATTTRGTFRSSRLDERQVVHRLDRKSVV